MRNVITREDEPYASVMREVNERLTYEKMQEFVEKFTVENNPDPKLWDYETVQSYFDQVEMEEKTRDLLRQRSWDGRAVASEDFPAALQKQGVSHDGMVRTMIAVEAMKRYSMCPIVDPTRKEFVLTKCLENIKIPPNKSRCFYYRGPLDFREHFHIPSTLRMPSLRLCDLEDVVANHSYLSVTGMERIGKTTFALDFRDALNSLPGYIALDISLDFMKSHRFLEDHVPFRLLDELARSARCNLTYPPLIHFINPKSPGGPFLAGLQKLSESIHASGRKFLLIIDNIDAGTGDMFINFLRDVQSLIDKRFSKITPDSVILLTSRELSDIRSYSREEDRFIHGNELVQCQHCFQIPPFNFHELRALAAEYKSLSGVEITDGALRTIYVFTHGHPWCVNRLLSTLTSQVEGKNTIDEDAAYLAVDDFTSRRGDSEFVYLLREAKMIQFKEIDKDKTSCS